MGQWDGWRDFVPPTSAIPLQPTPDRHAVRATPKEAPAVSPYGFVTLCRLAGLPKPECEFRFHQTRRWRFDFAWTGYKLALEVQGGLFTAGRHTRGAALLREHEKLNAAAACGYRVLFCTPQQIADGTALGIVKAAL